MSDMHNKQATRQFLRDRLATIDPKTRHERSMAACSLVASTREFVQARVIMLYLSMPDEVDTAPLALRSWQAGKTVVVPKVSWDQRRMLPVEISSLSAGITSTRPGMREPIGGKPIPLDMIDLVIVPGLGFSVGGHRIGRGMGFYDRFLSQADFIGRSSGLGFDLQLLESLPVLDHDVPLSMLVTDRQIVRFAPAAIHC